MQKKHIRRESKQSLARHMKGFLNMAVFISGRGEQTNMHHWVPFVWGS